MLKKYAHLIEPIQALKGVHINYKLEWGAYQYLVAGKMFAYLGTDNQGHEILTLKGDPANNKLMIEMYDYIIEGYYMNKIHWITIRLNDLNPVSQELIIDLLKKFYQLIFNKLAKKTQLEITS